MRWQIIKQAWELARKKFPGVKRLYVDLPHGFRDAGGVDIVDLEKPDVPIGKIAYRMSCHEGRPILFLEIESEQAAVAMPKTASMILPIKVSAAKEVSSVFASEMVAGHENDDDLAESVAYVVMGHKEGPLNGSRSIGEAALGAWISEKGFPAKIAGKVAEKLRSLGVEIETGFVLAKKKKKEKEFGNKQRVRIVSPNSMQFGEGGYVLDTKRDKKEVDWYSVVVDGSETPGWFREDEIENNAVGNIGNVSTQEINQRNIVPKTNLGS